MIVWNESYRRSLRPSRDKGEKQTSTFKEAWIDSTRPVCSRVVRPVFGACERPNGPYDHYLYLPEVGFKQTHARIGDDLPDPGRRKTIVRYLAFSAGL